MEKVGLFHFARSNAGRPRAFAGTPACATRPVVNIFFARSASRPGLACPERRRVLYPGLYLPVMRERSLLTGRCFLGASGAAAASGEAPRVASARLADRATRGSPIARRGRVRFPAPPLPPPSTGSGARDPSAFDEEKRRRMPPSTSRGRRGVLGALEPRANRRARAWRSRARRARTPKPRARRARDPRERRARARGGARRDARGANARAQPEASLRSAVWRGDCDPSDEGLRFAEDTFNCSTGPPLSLELAGKPTCGCPCDRPLRVPKGRRLSSGSGTFYPDYKHIHMF